MEVPALSSLSSLRVSTRKHLTRSKHDTVHFQVRAEGEDGFRLLYDTPNDDKLGWEWDDLTRNAGAGPALVRFEGQDLDFKEGRELKASPLPLFEDAKVLEIGASFASFWYRRFWSDIGNIGPQLTTLRLEVVEGMAPEVATSVGEFVETRFEIGMPVNNVERMEFEGMSEEEEKSKRLWEEFWPGLGICEYCCERLF